MGIMDKLNEVLDGRRLVKAIEDLTERLEQVHVQLATPPAARGVPLHAPLAPPPQTFSVRVPIGEDFNWPPQSDGGQLVCIDDIAFDLSVCSLPDNRFRVLLDAQHALPIVLNGFAFRFRPLRLNGTVVSHFSPLQIRIERDPDAPPLLGQPAVDASVISMKPTTVPCVITGQVMMQSAWDPFPCATPGLGPTGSPIGSAGGSRLRRAHPRKPGGPIGVP